MPDKLDVELEGLLGRLDLVHEAVGGRERKEDGGPAADANMDDFSRAKYAIGKCIIAMRDTLPMIETAGNGGGGGIDGVRLNQDFQANEMKANQIWNELDALQRKELSKKHSKFKAELPQRSKDVADLRRELDRLRDERRALLNPSYKANRRNVNRMEDSELFKATGDGDGTVNPSGYAAGQSANNNMTAEQKQQLQALEARENEIDEKYVAQIGEGLDYLLEKAENFGERLREQDRKITEIQEKADEVTDRLETVNGSMKETLNKARGSDKICMDIMCIMAMLGLIGVLYQMTTS
uniref:t-SNARE coiled-coil homology domain-containing protein n=1 Tax=Phaeomonas parva TaxID=124430 RepID=A0A7S1TVQ5_9STRA|mmetsp:Transcript_19251/g.58218  ORF Transcript_19251/g.58218 Transcript_19251/m.58218 type:complete len:296 (+) Transcript_19251:127-1014(+)|eukprot:CAMPEP_0118872316 /NCGR_PEP_ID=MMETSP1163-20130328/14547_1 /TAXON_ID=124430 /ORGANISM="Phaeomonas parva, Strain CCMP2877" /LENGTH=295 /DNA_ID=CAMNT_0006807489 /DNA_START=195 /DNA_END=1082 /DNA_ORIENTATION=+